MGDAIKEDIIDHSIYEIPKQNPKQNQNEGNDNEMMDKSIDNNTRDDVLSFSDRVNRLEQTDDYHDSLLETNNITVIKESCLLESFSENCPLDLNRQRREKRHCKKKG